ncbi:hypothetical protein HYQ46_010917 [Verticillium longisporum]|nr:hypothetical protein HYQ46_010917 [Verticillium longisporum]
MRVKSLDGGDLNGQPAEAAAAGHVLLQLDHALLVAVGLEALAQHAEALAVARDLVPVAAHVLQVLGEPMMGLKSTRARAPGSRR